jgi:hypothetical protein
MSNPVLLVDNTEEDAQRVLLHSIQAGIEYARDQGIDIALIQRAALVASDFLRKFGTPAKVDPKPGLKVVRPDARQGRLF